jgi:chemotaxis protein MotB
MQANGIRQDQVTQVRGIADQALRKPNSPQDPSNRRISLIVQYEKKPPDADPVSNASALLAGSKPADATK